MLDDENLNRAEPTRTGGRSGTGRAEHGSSRTDLASGILILHFGCLAEAAASSFADVAGGQENSIVTGPQTFSDSVNEFVKNGPEDVCRQHQEPDGRN